MKVALFDVDSKIPNLALMKLSAYHKARGDSVELYQPLFIDSYDWIYASTIFDFSDKSALIPERMAIGGTGWPDAKGLDLPGDIERMTPDYSLYGYAHSIGFTMRGCRLRCPFCVVPEKEGRPKPNNTIDEIWTQRDSDFIMLLDNDFFGNPEWPARIAELQQLNLRVNFTQGLNIRNLKAEQAEALASIRFRSASGAENRVHFAWDDPRHEKLVRKGIATALEAGISARQMQFYVLIGYWSSPTEDLHRVEVLRELGCDPYAMPYDRTDPYQRKFARWVNHKALFNSVSFADYHGPRVKPQGVVNEDQLDLWAI